MERGQLQHLLFGLLNYYLLALRISIDWISDILFSVYYSFYPKIQLPQLRSTILLESATVLAKKIRSREFRSIDVVEEFISRINDINPIINAVVADRFEEAREEANHVDRILDSNDALLEEYSEEKKPFFGVPFTSKECIRVTGLPNTSGLYLRKGFFAKEDAEVVKRMREAGAIPLAVTNISEICMWWESSNKVYGQTNNPYNTNRTPGGSSGGEAALLAACGSPCGIGSDIGGSIRMPAFFNGIFCHKPTYGLVPNTGQFPDAQGNLDRFLVTGPMCRFAEDLIPLYKVMLGPKAARLSLDTPVDLSKCRIYFALNDGGHPLISPVDRSIKEALLQAVRYLETTCHSEIAPAQPLSALKYSIDIWTSMVNNEKCRTFGEDLANREGNVNLFLELLKWLVGRSPHTFPSIYAGLVEAVLLKLVDRRAYYTEMGKELKEQLVEMLDNDGVFLYPTHPRTAPYHHQPLLMMYNFAYTGIFNVLGLPSTHVPLGLDKNGLPLGIQVVSNHYNDRLCLAVAKELESGFGGWICP